MRALAACAFVVTITDPAVAQTTTRVSVDSSGNEADRGVGDAAISADGRFVAFASFASNLVPGDTNKTEDVFVHDRVTGLTERVSVDSAGLESNGDSMQVAISADGGVVAFVSGATNLVSGDTNAAWDIFVHDRTTGVTERVSVDSNGAESNDYSNVPSLSADGRVVAFGSSATNLISNDTNGFSDVFVRDRVAGVTERISVDSSGAEGDGNAGGGFSSISSDGRSVAFVSGATNLVAGDTNGRFDIFVHDRTTGVTERVSVDSNGNEADDSCYSSALSSDGHVVAFESGATNLVPGDGNGLSDVFVHDRTSGVTERASVDGSGADSDGTSQSASLSADGRWVGFTSGATDLDTGDTNHVQDAFVRDRAQAITRRISLDTAGVQGDDSSGNPLLSADASVVAFFSRASNLVTGDSGKFSDWFVREECPTDASWNNYGGGFPGTLGVPGLVASSDPATGSTVSVAVGNSPGFLTVALLFVGFQQIQVHSALGGDLLVLPQWTVVLAVGPGGSSITGDIPLDGTLCGSSIELQAWEADAGAAKGVSFTPGLELILGR
jgi:hypothetical protein